MADVRLTRKENLLKLAEPFKTQTDFAHACGVSFAQLMQVLKTSRQGTPIRMVGEKLARRIEANLALEPRWLDISHDENEIGNLSLRFPGSSPTADAAGPLPTAGRASTAPESPDSMNVAGLTLLQKAAVETLIKLALQGGLSDRDCVELLGAWTNQLEQFNGENQSSAETA
jgi:hypothetical protein